MSKTEVVELLEAWGQEMTKEEFCLVVSIVSRKIRRAIDRAYIPEMTLSAFKLNKLITDDHVIKTQAEILTDICGKVDHLKSENMKLKMECLRLTVELGWLRSPAYRPMGVKINAD